jgi:tripartite-type tricarboxylate transporter receptor subunit TctC
MGARRLFVAALLTFAFGLAHAGAQTYPSQTVRIVVPFTPGGPVDSLARVIAQYLPERLGQNVIIENRTGGGTTIAAKAVAAAAPDGYTLLFLGPNLAYYPVLFPDLDFDPLKSFVPVATAVTWSHVLAVAPAVPANNVAELIAHAKSGKAGVRLRPRHHAAHHRRGLQARGGPRVHQPAVSRRRAGAR